MSEIRYNIVCGVDEAGRGPLAGPVFAAAVVLDPLKPVFALADSKKISANKRELLCAEIKQKALSWAIGRAEVEEIDQMNILQATLLAMKRAVLALGISPDLVLVDGNQKPSLTCLTQTVVKGDELIDEISAASIVAKVSRDSEMRALDCLYPQYGFSKHKGYPTREHVAALAEHGVSPVHRRSFGPVRRLL